jgi:hypothetical protein
MMTDDNLREHSGAVNPPPLRGSVMNETMTTAATEAIRIAETYLPKAGWKRQKALAQEIVKAIELCEAELGDEIAKKLKAMVQS